MDIGPFRVIRAAIKAVLAVRYALGVRDGRSFIGRNVPGHYKGGAVRICNNAGSDGAVATILRSFQSRSTPRSKPRVPAGTRPRSAGTRGLIR